MSYNVLIVEDQPLIAMDVQDVVESLGHHTVGIARNMYEALALASNADMALVDVNLEDGPTGPLIGKQLAQSDVAVLFMTSDPAALRGGVPGTLGVIVKPILSHELTEAVQFVAARRANSSSASAPESLVEFTA